MSLKIAYPAPQNMAKVKQFFWDVKDRRNVERGIGGYYNNDTTASSSINSTTRVTVKSYTFTSSAMTNKIRVRIYGYSNSTAYTTHIYLNINGTDVASWSGGLSTSAVLIIDYIGNLSPNTAYTIHVDGYISSSSGYFIITQVSITAGFGLTSTTSVSILSITLDSANDVYTLNVTGNFVYKLGVRWWVYGNRKTTANATIVSNLANEIQSIPYSPGAGDDGDNNAIIRLRTGDYATSFTISGYVGATGDVIIITGIYCQIMLRSVNDSLNLTDHHILIKEKGVTFISSIHATIDGGSTFSAFYSIGLSGANVLYNTSNASFVKATSLQFTTNDAPECSWRLEGGREIYGGNGIFLYVNIIVLGV
jgi:hypothetical protein